jgi:DNA polymerase III sliding clamp (beta) subunit (PCNA family)
MKVNRAELLQCLEVTQPGLSPKELIQQSSCFVFRGGRVYTFNEETSCRAPTPLPKDFEVAVPGNKLLAVLRAVRDDEVVLELKGDRLLVKGKRRAEINAQTEIVLPYNEVDRPGEWTALNPDFAEAVQMVESCVEDNNDSKLRFVHVHPEYVEGCDNFQMARYFLETGVEQSAFVRRQGLKAAVALGVTSFSDCENWIHFRCARSIISCRKWQEDYPDYESHFDFEGLKVALPKAVGEAAAYAEIFAQEIKDDPQVTVEIEKGWLRVLGEGVTGRAWEPLRINYDGPSTGFRIDPKLLASIVEKHQNCEIGNGKLRAEGRCWKYCTVLGTIDSPNGHAEEQPTE